MTRSQMVAALLLIAKARNKYGISVNIIVRQYITQAEMPDFEAAKAEILALPEYRVALPSRGVSTGR